MSNDIAVNMLLKNQQYMQGMQQSMRATEQFDRGITRTRVNFLKYDKALQSNARLSGQHRMVLQNSIYMVEDAASVYGTMGLAGAVRAASNNLTVMASAFGPLGMAAAVTLTTITQLYFAFNKGEKETDKATDALEKYRHELEKTSDLVARQKGFQLDLSAEFDIDQLKGMGGSRAREAKILQAQIDDLFKQEQQLRATSQFVEGDTPNEQRANFDAKMLEIAAQRAKLERERRQVAGEVAEIQAKINTLMKQSRDRQIEERDIAKSMEGINQRIAQQKQQQIEREQMLLAQQHQEEMRRTQQRHENERQQIRQTQQAGMPSGALKGSRDAAAAMLKQGGRDPMEQLSKRDRASLEAIQRQRDALNNPDRDIKGNDKRRQAALAELGQRERDIKGAAGVSETKTVAELKQMRTNSDKLHDQMDQLIEALGKEDTPKIVLTQGGFSR